MGKLFPNKKTSWEKWKAWFHWVINGSSCVCQKCRPELYEED